MLGLRAELDLVDAGIEMDSVLTVRWRCRRRKVNEVIKLTLNA